MVGKWLIGLLAVMGAGTAWAQSAPPGAPVGTITQVQGAATATRTAGSVTLQLNTPVYSDDLLETEANAKILVQFTDGTKLTLGPSAEVLIDEFVFNAAGGTNNAAIRVTAGAMRLVAGAIEKVGGPQAINVATPVASIGVRGTDFFIEMEEADHLSVALFSGYEVAVTNPSGTTVLRPGEGTDIWGHPGEAVAPSQALTWGTDRVNRALALVTITPLERRPLYYAQPIAPELSPQGALTQGTFKIDVRYRWEFVEQDSRAQSAHANTVRVRAGYETAAYQGFFAGIEGEFTRDIFGGRRSDGVTNFPTIPVIPDPDSEVLNRAYVGWTRPDADGMSVARVVLGRQRIMYDNERWIGPSNFRQNDQTFDAFTAEGQVIPGVNARYAYLNRINRVLGNNPNGHWGSDSHLLSVATNKTPFGIATAYAYLLDLNPVPRLSSATFGVRYDALVQYRDDLAFGLEAELARQSDYAGNPGSYGLTYFLLRPMVKWNDETLLAAGWERLGGNGIDAVQTPLATLHRHNGWADVFLTTPVNGLDDKHVRLMQELPDAGWFKSPRLDLRFHDFHAARGGAHYGVEWDADLNFSVLSRATLGVRFARYDAKSYDTDTTKAWFYIEVQY